MSREIIAEVIRNSVFCLFESPVGHPALDEAYLSRVRRCQDEAVKLFRADDDGVADDTTDLRDAVKAVITADLPETESNSFIRFSVLAFHDSCEILHAFYQPTCRQPTPKRRRRDRQGVDDDRQGTHCDSQDGGLMSVDDIPLHLPKAVWGHAEEQLRGVN